MVCTLYSLKDLSSLRERSKFDYSPAGGLGKGFVHTASEGNEKFRRNPPSRLVQDFYRRHGVKYRELEGIFRFRAKAVSTSAGYDPLDGEIGFWHNFFESLQDCPRTTTRCRNGVYPAQREPPDPMGFIRVKRMNETKPFKDVCVIVGESFSSKSRPSPTFTVVSEGFTVPPESACLYSYRYSPHGVEHSCEAAVLVFGGHVRTTMNPVQQCHQGSFHRTFSGFQDANLDAFVPEMSTNPVFTYGFAHP